MNKKIYICKHYNEQAISLILHQNPLNENIKVCTHNRPISCMNSTNQCCKSSKQGMPKSIIEDDLIELSYNKKSRKETAKIFPPEQMK